MAVKNKVKNIIKLGDHALWGASIVFMVYCFAGRRIISDMRKVRSDRRR